MLNQACMTQQKQERIHDDSQQMRANSYALIAALLAKPPEQELLEKLQGIAVQANDSKDIVNAWNMLRLAAETNHAEAVADEYYGLFIGIGRGELVPFASWYLTGFLMEKPLAHLRQRLAQLGFERQEGVHEPEDHAAALCEVMSQLILDQDITFEEQQKFYQEFMGNWMEKFFNDMQGAETAGFYRAVGQLGESFMNIEKRYFSMMV
ncbi:MAG: TorD/DmsD family molecular chaperone [Gammaproteobacteria bacterium]